MVVCVCRSARDATAAAASVVASAVQQHPSAVLALPTGRTVVPFYEALVRLHRRRKVRFRRATAFALDEFCGLGRDAPQSFQAFLHQHFFRHVDLPRARRHALNGITTDWRGETSRYERAISRAGGFDICVLGIGRNGHIAFNEPAASLRQITHRQRLTLETRRGNAAAFAGRTRAVPAFALTVGMGAIRHTRHVMLIATGSSKAGIVRRALVGPVTPRVPASLLRRHPRLTVILDRAAAAEL